MVHPACQDCLHAILSTCGVNDPTNGPAHQWMFAALADDSVYGVTKLRPESRQRVMQAVMRNADDSSKRHFKQVMMDFAKVLLGGGVGRGVGRGVGG